MMKRNKGAEEFSLKKAPLIINYNAEKELNFEESKYSVNKKLVNRLADLGYVPYEDNMYKFQRFVKIHNSLLIQIKYKVSQRRAKPDEEIDYEAEHENYVNSINQFFKGGPMRRQTGFKDESKPLNDPSSNRHYLEGIRDPPEDTLDFELTVINKEGQGVR